MVRFHPAAPRRQPPPILWPTQNTIQEFGKTLVAKKRRCCRVQTWRLAPKHLCTSWLHPLRSWLLPSIWFSETAILPAIPIPLFILTQVPHLHRSPCTKPCSAPGSYDPARPRLSGCWPLASPPFLLFQSFQEMRECTQATKTVNTVLSRDAISLPWAEHFLRWPAVFRRTT